MPKTITLTDEQFLLLKETLWGQYLILLCRANVYPDDERIKKEADQLLELRRLLMEKSCQH